MYKTDHYLRAAIKKALVRITVLRSPAIAMSSNGNNSRSRNTSSEYPACVWMEAPSLDGTRKRTITAKIASTWHVVTHNRTLTIALPCGRRIPSRLDLTDRKNRISGLLVGLDLFTVVDHRW
jgi:hypothetical protein